MGEELRALDKVALGLDGARVWRTVAEGEEEPETKPSIKQVNSGVKMKSRSSLVNKK